MTGSDPLADSRRSQTALSEAVEQAADALGQWSNDITRFAKGEADKLAAGEYGLADLMASPVSLLRIWVKNTICTMDVLRNNLALVAHGQPHTPSPPRAETILVNVPANAGGVLTASELVGRVIGYRISSSKVQVVPHSLDPESTPREAEITIVVDDPHAPNDFYEGVVCPVDRSFTASYGVAVDELGETLT